MIPRLDIPQRTNIFPVRKLLVAQILIFLIVSLPICYSAQYSLSYDANGNLITGDGKYRVYNSLNQLYQIYNGTNSSGLLLESYQYHPTEERVHVKTVYNATGGIKETVYYISKSFVQVVNSSGEYNYTYVYQNGQLVAQKNPDGTKYFIVSDAEGSATVVTNVTGQMIENNSYSPYGEVLTGGTKSRYGYEDKERDSLVGDTDFNFRKYKPQWGIFTQPDTLIQNVYDPQSLNRYSFERNNPYKNIDSTGHSIGAIAIGAIVGAVVGAVSYTLYANYFSHDFSWTGFAASTAGGAVAGAGGIAIIGAVGTSVAGFVLAGSASNVAAQITENAINGKDITEDIGFAALSGGLTGSLGKQLPSTKEWLIKKPLSWLTSKTGQQFMSNEFVQEVSSAILSILKKSSDSQKRKSLSSGASKTSSQASYLELASKATGNPNFGGDNLCGKAMSCIK